jgi:hypothetical protein
LDENNLKMWPKEHGGGAPSPVCFKINADGSQKLESTSAQHRCVNLQCKEEDAKARLASAAKAEGDCHAIQLHMQQLEKRPPRGRRVQKGRSHQRKTTGRVTRVAVMDRMMDRILI